MNTIDTSTLMPEEREGVELVQRLGMAKANELLVSMNNEAKARMDKALEGCHPGEVPSGYTALNWMSDSERARFHMLQQGITLCSDPVGDAKARIKARLAERKAQREQRRAAV